MPIKSRRYHKKIINLVELVKIKQHEDIKNK